MSAFEFRVLVLAGMMGVGGIAGAQSVQLTASELTAKAELLGRQTFKRKSGDVLTFQQIYALPSQQRDAVIDEMTEQEAEVMYQWKKQARAATNARIKEASAEYEAADRNLAKIRAENEAADRNLAKIRAEGEALDRSISEESANLVRNLEKLSLTIRTLVAMGGVMGLEDKILLESSLRVPYVYANLKSETLSLFKSVLARPELFRDK